MKLRPLRDQVLVRRSDAETTTESGLVIPDTAGEKPSKGEVVAAGPGRTDDSGKTLPMAVKPGDQVVFGQYAGSNTIKVEGEELLLMGESDILAVIEG